MSIAIHLIGPILGLAGATYSAVFIVGPWFMKILLPPTAVDLPNDPIERAMLRNAEMIVRRGVRTVVWPVSLITFPAGFVALLLVAKSSDWTVAMLILGCAVAVAAAWQAVAVRRWWAWAVGQDVDLSIVEELAVRANLVWSRHTRLGRRQRQVWMRLPPGPVRSN